MKKQEIRILHVIGRLGRGGDSTAVFAVQKALEERGVQFDFLTHTGYNSDTVARLRTSGSQTYILSGDVRRMGPLRYYKTVCHLLREHSYDGVHFHTSLQSGIGLLAAKRVGVPIRVCHAHAAAIQRKVSPILLPLAILLRRMLLMGANRRAACGMEAGRFLFGKKSFCFVPNSIDLKRFSEVPDDLVRELRCQLGIRENAMVLGQIGRFDEMKNQLFSLKAAAAVAQETMRPVALVFVGDGEGRERVEKAAREVPATLQVIFAGYRTDIPVFLRLFDLLLVPSRKGEGVPITLLEAQAANCQALASEHVPREVELGLGLIRFFPLGRPESWQDAIKTAEERPTLEWEMIRRAFSKHGYEQEQIVERWLKLYEI